MGEFLGENGVLIKYEGTGGDIIVPDDVVTIGSGVFFNRNDIKSVVIPQGVTYLEYGVFERCTNLEKVVLPEGLVAIHNCIFKDCTSLVEVVLPDSLETLGRSMFSNCTSLKTVKLPKNLKSMYGSFVNCVSLETIEIPDSVTKIEDTPFWRCQSLKKIIFGKHTPGYGFQASDLYGCSKLEEIVIPEDNEYYKICEGVIFTKDGKEIVYCLPTVRGEYVIPDGVEIIRQAAFRNCEEITNIVIPNSVKEIQREAFAGCRGITTLVVPDSVEEIGDYAFDRDFLSDISRDKLKPYTRISFGTSSGKTIAKQILDFPFGESPLVYPELPLSIISDRDIKIRLAIGFCLNSDLYEGEYAKGYQKYAKSQQKNILEYASKINENAVEEYYKGLEKNEKISERKEKESETIQEIDYGESAPIEDFECDGDILVKYLGMAKRVVIPKCIKGIKSDAFFKNNTIEEIVILGVEGCLLERTFSECKKLKRVILSSGITQIEKRCFVKCPKLEKITILAPEMTFNQDLFKVKAGLDVIAPEMSPASFKVIYRSQVIKSFATAYVEKRIYKPSKDSKMIAYLKRQSHQMYQLFDQIPELLRVMIDYSLIPIRDAQTLYAQYEKNASFEAMMLKEYLDLKGKSKCDIKTKKKDSIAEIKKDWVYKEYSYIDKSTGSKVKAIKITKYKGFVTDVVIPETIGSKIVDRIDILAFNGNKIITSVVIPESIKSIGIGAFGCCSSLQRVEIKGKNVSLGAVCFGSCVSLTEFIADYDTLIWGQHMFQDCHKLMSPDGFVLMGEERRKRLVDVRLPISTSEVKIPEGVVIIGDYAFSEYDGGNMNDGHYVEKLQKVILPETVETIGREAFSKCVNLREINIPSSVTQIMLGAFSRCDSLRYISIPESVSDLQPIIFGLYVLNEVNVIGKKGGNVEKYIEKTYVENLNNSEKKVNFFSIEEQPPQVGGEFKDFDIVRGKLIKYFGRERKVIIPECVTQIEMKAFGENKDISEVVVTGNTKIINSFAFSGAVNLRKVELQEGIEVISEYAFCETGIEELIVPGTVKKIGDSAFSSCKKLKSVVIKHGVKKICRDAFSFCKRIEKVEIPDSVDEIGKDAFFGCNKLRDIDLPEHIANIDEFLVRTE